jgi:hypothetical protein
LASLFCGSEPASISVLLSGQNAEADRMMAEVFRENVLDVLFCGEFNEILAVAERPLLVQVQFPCDPEWAPAVQLLAAALASVYFRDNLEPKCR